MKLATLLFVALLSTASCGGTDAQDRRLLVSAASSLSGAFAEIESVFEEANPEVDLILNLGGSSQLREQILQGAPADVFASANPEIMAELVDAGRLAAAPRDFAVNRLVIAVPRGNPAAVDGLEDFDDGSLLIGLCAPDVPCGRLARSALAAAGVAADVDTEEPSVRALLVKIEAGELDAGLTYATDVLASDEVDAIEVPGDHTALYQIAVVSGSPTADEFVRFVLSDEGLAILADHGFGLP